MGQARTASTMPRGGRFLLGAVFGGCIYFSLPLLTGKPEPLPGIECVPYVIAIFLAGFVLGFTGFSRMWEPLCGLFGGQVLAWLLLPRDPYFDAAGWLRVGLLGIYTLPAVGSYLLGAVLRSIVGPRSPMPQDRGSTRNETVMVENRAPAPARRSVRVVLVGIGTLGGLYAAAGAFQLVRVLWSTDSASANGGSMTAAAVLPICLGLIVCLACLQRAFRA